MPDDPQLVEMIAALPDSNLAAPLRWSSGQTTVEQAIDQLAVYQPLRAEIRAILSALDWNAPAAIRHLAWAPIARARLEASLAGVPDDLLDRHPFPGEWSVRQQLAHVELTDVRYTIATQYAVRRKDGEPLSAPPEAYPPRDDNPAGNAGEPLAAILSRMRAVRADALAPLLGISAGELLRPTEWHTAEHTIGFRLHRFAQHDLELTTDIRRTLAASGFRPTRAMNLAATLVEAGGELDSDLLGVPEGLYDREVRGSRSLRACLAHRRATAEYLLGRLRSESAARAD